MIDKEQAKKEFNTKLRMIIVAIIVFCVSVILVSVIVWFLKLLDTKENDKDPKNAPAAARRFMNDTNIDENGKITLGKSIAEWWEELKKSGNKITKYLNSPEELAKLMNAAMALEYPDTRKNPGDKIKWNNIDINSTEIQGIVKFKRALANGKNIYMTFVSPTEFQELINKYKSTGSEKDKNEALKHFTIEKVSSSSSSSASTVAKVSSLNGMVFMGDSILSTFNEFKRDELKKEGVTYFYKSGCNASYFTGKATVDNSDYNTIEKAGGYFDWDANFQKVTNPTGFYLMLGQNALSYKDNNKRIEEIDELVKKIRSHYPTPPIYISSVLHYIDSDGSAKRAADEMNEGLKEYCNKNDNVYYSDILRGYNDNLEAMTKSDNDHPNEHGVQVLFNNIKENIIGTSQSSNSGTVASSQTSSSIVGSTPEEIAGISRTYNNDVLNVDGNSWVDPMVNMNPPYNNGSESREYRAIQSCCYDGKCAIAAQNKNVGNDWRTSNDGGRIIWLNLQNGELEHELITSEGGHMGEGITYDTERNMVIFHTGSGNILEIDNNTKSISGHSKTSEYPGIITYLSTTKQLVGVDGGQLKFFKYDSSKNEYVKQSSVKLNSWNMKNGFQGAGNDGQCIYVFDSSPGGSNQTVWVYSLDGQLREEHSLGSGYPRGKECESGFADNEGNLWIGTNHSLVKVINYKANPANVNPGSSSTTNTLNMTYQVKVATWSEHQDKLVSEDPDVKPYDTGMVHDMTTTVIPYQAIVSKYRMPFNYLWTMLVYSQDKDYTFDLADLVKNSKIEITIHDNYNETINVVTDKYTKYKKVYTTANANVDYKYLDIQTITDTTTLIPTTKDIQIEKSDSTPPVSVDADSVYDPEYTNVHTTINRNNTLDIALTLADSWFVKYTKEYTYNEPTNTTSPPNTSTLDDIWNAPETVKGDFGGHKDTLTKKAENKATEIGRNKHGSAFDFNVKFYDVKTKYTRGTINRSTTTESSTESSSYVSSVPGSSGGSSWGSSTLSSNVKSGTLNADNYKDLVEPSIKRSSSNTLQGFCLVGDDLIAFVMNNYDKCTLYLADINTMELYSHMDGLYDHGNSIAYDPINGDILYPENGKIHLIAVDRATKQLGAKRTIDVPKANKSPSRIAYNATHDLFIVGRHIYTRQGFYSGGSPIASCEKSETSSKHLFAGSSSYGNHVYFFNALGYKFSKNYIIVCDVRTGEEVEIIQDNMAREGEEISFSSDGTLFAAYAEGGPPFKQTDYNYFSDTNIDISNVTPGMGGKAVNDISRYNTGGEYDKKNGFAKAVRVLNSHYNARSNILSVTEWLFEALEQNPDTEPMADLTRYLLHKATGNNYGEYGNKEFDYEAYDPSGFIEIGAGGLEGNTTEERVWLALVNAGFNDVQAAAVMGNLSYESGGSSSKTIKTDVVEGGYTENNGGIGMCQWTNGNRGTEGRNTQLKKYAQSKGTTWKDETTQIEFLMTEITGTGSAKGYANYQFMTKTYDGVTYSKDALKSVENNAGKIEYATKAFAATFERPAASAFTKSMSKRVELANYFYSQYNGKRSSSTGNGDILKACEEVMKLYLSRNAEYSIQRPREGSLIYGNIEKCVNEAKYACCATYTSSVLYKSGLLTADQINKYNYHYTGSKGIPDMLKAAGWRQVNMSDIKAGDVVVDYGVHVLIYAGGDNYYDNKTCIHGSEYGGYYSATKSVRSGFSYYRNKNVQIWRAPGK